ncbi:MAG: 5'/3'-nucleotidase SurE [Gemmatimonadetes bacterium]|nr:5'/3'-nucleotidase SurE [Gemmatimonadota bacterium]
MLILCTNDDGSLASGLRVLKKAASPLGEVRVVAPDREQSATSHSLTLHYPLRAREASAGEFIVDGTPTDCVILAVNTLLQRRPDVVLCGVNHGANLGDDVLYSGTVAAAMEATVIGIPAIAISYTGDSLEEIERWGPLLTRFLRRVLENRRFPESTLLNVNLPPIAPEGVHGIRVTTLGRRVYSDSLTRAVDPSGREYFWLGGGVSKWSGSADSDFRCIEEGYISVTPLHLDLTNYSLLEEIRGWNLAL